MTLLLLAGARKNKDAGIDVVVHNKEKILPFFGIVFVGIIIYVMRLSRKHAFPRLHSFIINFRQHAPVFLAMLKRRIKHFLSPLVRRSIMAARTFLKVTHPRALAVKSKKEEV